MSVGISMIFAAVSSFDAAIESIITKFCAIIVLHILDINKILTIANIDGKIVLNTEKKVLIWAIIGSS